MSRYEVSAAALALCLSIAVPAHAGGPLVINFDTDTNGQPIASGTSVSTLYSSWGVTLENTDGSCGDSVYASSECLSRGTTSPPNVVTTCDGGCSDIAENFQGLVRAVFASAAEEVCIDYTTAGEGEEGVIRAYDGAHQLLDEQISQPGVSGQLCVSASGIASVEFSGHGGLYGWFDNLAVQFAPVPTLPVTFSAIKLLYR